MAIVPKKTAHQAVQRVAKAIVQCKTHIIDLDLKAYFDTVRHHLLLEKVARRINDDEVMRVAQAGAVSIGKTGCSTRRSDFTASQQHLPQ